MESILIYFWNTGCKYKPEKLANKACIVCGINPLYKGTNF